jgi:hypothetical protein
VPELDLARVQALVEEAIDHGASTVGEIHQAVAAAPLEILHNIEPLAGMAETAEELTHRTIGAVYDTIRRVNEQVGVLAEQLLREKDDLIGE